MHHSLLLFLGSNSSPILTKNLNLYKQQHLYSIPQIPSSKIHQKINNPPKKPKKYNKKIITHQKKPTKNKKMGKISVKQQAFNSLGSLIKLLPTGTVFLFQFLSPILSNNGQCHTSNKYLMGVLLVICGFNCCFATFTDSYVDEDGNTHYGIATNKGLWPSNKGSSKSDLSKYRLRVGDFVHAFMSLLVFGVVAVLDKNTVDCYAPAWESSRKTMLMVLPPVVGGLCSGVFAMFPSTRHGIGYPYDNDSTS